MFEGAKLGELRKKLRDLITARDAGYKIPELLVTEVENQIMELEGIREVWECIQCRRRQTMFVRATMVYCCGRGAKKVWASKTALSPPS